LKSVAVVGAGCFGVWTAWHLAQAGHAVVLIEAHGPGNTRASSGGETRIIRMGYGAQEIYTRWSMRSLAMWKELSARTGLPLFHETGVLWMARDDDPLSAATLATLGRCQVRHERLTHDELNVRYRQIDWGSITWAIHEPESGVLMARRAVAAMAGEAARAGARYVQAAVQPLKQRARGAAAAIATRSGERLAADAFVFACGPWLPALFPDLVADRIVPTRQEVLYFGPPAGDARFSPPSMPAWVDFGAEIYGIPDIDSRGFKISIDRHGPAFDPDTGSRSAGQTVAEARDYIRRRFPDLREAPLVASEVCQYENTSNGDFLIDRHPEMANVWLVGGGSGHGFKHGPAVGEYVARLVGEDGAPDTRFSLATKDKVRQRAVF
jgi:sarcosine oxidase